MMRKFNKKKGSRQGAILVTVVFILAFAIIFIAAAMMLTQSTRKRIYSQASSNQARLTVTSVAEAFYRAVKKCEFEDDDIIKLCKGNDTIKVQANSNSDTIPGLENYGSTNPDSYTTVEFKRVNKAGGGTTDNDYIYYAEFSTHIDGHVENVRATLTYTKPTYDKTGAPFSSQIDLNGEFGNNNLKLVGEGKEDDPDNIFLVRKGGMNMDDGFSTHAVMVYCDGAVAFKSEDFLAKDVVFLSGAYLKSLRNDDTNPKGNLQNLFFFGDEGSVTDISQGDPRNFNGEIDNRALNFFLLNRSNPANSKWTEKANVYEINSAGEITNTLKGSTFTPDAAFKKKVAKYYSYNASYKNGGTNAFPSIETFLKSAKSKLKNSDGTELGKTHPSSATSSSLQSFLEKYNYFKYKDYLPAGDYYFNSDGTSTENNNRSTIEASAAKNIYAIVLKGGEHYNFWFAANTTFKMFDIVFIVNDPTPSTPTLFLLESGAKVYWPGGNNASGGHFCGNGILAVQGRKFDDHAKTYKHLMDNVDKGATAFENTSNKYSKHYDGKNEPCAMVIGINNNLFQTDQNFILEAFIGLFNYEKNGGTSRTSFRNANNSVFYGRLMCDQLGFGEGEQKDSSSIIMPASPGASSLPSPDPAYTKILTGFSLVSMQYYYGLTET